MTNQPQIDWAKIAPLFSLNQLSPHVPVRSQIERSKEIACVDQLQLISSECHTFL